MLSKKDVERIRELIREEFRNALFREITIQRKARGPGEVDGKIETSTNNLLDALAMSVPHMEQAIVGAAAASEQSRNRSIESLSKIDSLGATLSSMEESVMVMARFAVSLKETGLLEQLEKALEIEYTGPKAIKDEANTG